MPPACSPTPGDGDDKRRRASCTATIHSPVPAGGNKGKQKGHSTFSLGVGKEKGKFLGGQDLPVGVAEGTASLHRSLYRLQLRLRLRPIHLHPPIFRHVDRPAATLNARPMSASYKSPVFLSLTAPDTSGPNSSSQWNGGSDPPGTSAWAKHRKNDRPSQIFLEN